MSEALEAVDYFDQKEKAAASAQPTDGAEEDLSAAAAAAIAALSAPMARPKVKHEFNGDSAFV